MHILSLDKNSWLFVGPWLLEGKITCSGAINILTHHQISLLKVTLTWQIKWAQRAGTKEMMLQRLEDLVSEARLNWGVIHSRNSEPYLQQPLDRGPTGGPIVPTKGNSSMAVMSLALWQFGQQLKDEACSYVSWQILLLQNRFPQQLHFDPIDSWDKQQKGKLSRPGNEVI